jgi:hypothetical protein
MRPAWGGTTWEELREGGLHRTIIGGVLHGTSMGGTTWDEHGEDYMGRASGGTTTNEHGGTTWDEHRGWGGLVITWEEHLSGGGTTWDEHGAGLRGRSFGRGDYIGRSWGGLHGTSMGGGLHGTLYYNGFFPMDVSVNFDFFQILGWAKVHPVYFMK